MTSGGEQNCWYLVPGGVSEMPPARPAVEHFYDGLKWAQLRKAFPTLLGVSLNPALILGRTQVENHFRAGSSTPSVGARDLIRPI